ECCRGCKTRESRLDTLDLLRGTKHGEGGDASQEGSGKETVVEGRHSASEEHGPQRPRRENRESSQANRRRDASKGEDRTHLDQHDPKEAREKIGRRHTPPEAPSPIDTPSRVRGAGQREASRNCEIGFTKL